MVMTPRGSEERSRRPSGGNIELIAQRILSERAKFVTFQAKRQSSRSLRQMEPSSAPIFGKFANALNLQFGIAVI